MELLEQFVRRFARRITVGGVTMLITDGDPLLTDAFEELGWQDPHPEVAEKAHVRDHEQAVMPKGETRTRR